MMRNKLFVCGLAALFVPVAAGAEGWTTLYLQPFGNDSGAFQQSWHYDWNWFHGADGAEGTHLHNRIHYFSGPPVREAVNAATPFGDSVTGGYWVIASTSMQFAFTEIDVSRDLYERISLSVDQVVTADDPWRFAVRLADDWFVSEFSFSNTGGWQSIEMELTPESVWMPLDFIPGGRLSVGAGSVALETLEGNVTAVGFFGKASTTASQRFDNFTVRVVPDPDAALTFGDWVKLNNLPNGERGLNGNPTNDGVANLQKFAFGLDPFVPVHFPLVTPDFERAEGEEFLAVEFPRALNAGGVQVHFEASQDLSDWQTVPADFETVAALAPNTALVRATDSEPVSRFDARFVRLQVEETTGYDENEPAGSVTREELRAAVSRYFGPGPDDSDAVDPQLVVTAKEDLGDHERWHLEYWVHEDDRATAYLLVPNPPPGPGEKLPLILAPHPTSLVGKDRAVGNYDNPPASDSEWREREARQYALHLVRRGFLVFAPDRAGFGERRLLDDPEASVTDQMNAYREFLRERWPGWKLTSGKNVWDLQRALDFLTELEFVDENRIASIGHSLGSWDSLMLAAMDDRVKAVVANAGGMVIFDEELWTDDEALRHYLDRTGAQGMRTNVNLYLMLIAPRPLLYIWSLNDPYEQGDPNVLEGMRTIHGYYQAQYEGTNPWWRPPFSIFFHDHGHDFPPEARILSYSWLERWLADD